MKLLSTWIDELRIYHWSKNCIIFLPLIAIQEFTLHNFIILITVFFLFSFFVSSTYIINDIFDIKSDIKHKVKKKRPIASSKISVNEASFVSSLIIILCLLFCYFNFKIEVFSIFIFYLILSITYTKFVKKIPILDILVLTIFYLTRLMLGGVVLDISISIWLFTFCFFIFLPLCCVKRIVEIKRFNKSSVRGYKKQDISFLNNISNASSLLSAVVILLYGESSNFKIYYNNTYFLFIISLVVIFWLLRVNFLANRGKVSHDPVSFALKDKLTYLILLLISILFIFNS